ncbi:regulator of microtubule dynamics protein 1-like [Diorhabda carinulata]|uniref:regulator of microtubule dynamics protein 1-like n=1 Tax=Diorhabda carinulata TaxID=1163345 RepID=UPI0025A2E7BA|nr:regulator of microtubule dynamics protein 1-like [Diorhabda carinulata]
MSKLKVSFYHAIKIFLVLQQQRNHLSAFSFLNIFFKAEDTNEEKLKKYFNHLTITETIVQADKFHENGKYLEVYETLNRIRLVNDPEVLWRIARALYNLNSSNKKLKKETRCAMMEEALFVLQLAFGNGGIDNAEVHKWMAVILDTHYGLINIEHRIKFSPLVREHLIKACELNSHDFTAHHMMGKWSFQMCRLSWFQRIIAKYLFGAEPPKSEYEVAYKYLLRAEELRPRTVLANLYLLGETCVKLGQFFKAKYYLNLAVRLRPKDENEKIIASKANHLMRRLERYDLGKNALFYDPLGFNGNL